MEKRNGGAMWTDYVVNVYQWRSGQGCRGGQMPPPADTKRRAPKLRQGANIPKLLKKKFYSR